MGFHNLFDTALFGFSKIWLIFLRKFTKHWLMKASTVGPGKSSFVRMYVIITEPIMLQAMKALQGMDRQRKET